MKKLLIVSLVVNFVLVIALGIFGYLFLQKKIIVAPPVVKPVTQMPTATIEVNKSWDLPVSTVVKSPLFRLTIKTVKITNKITSGKTQLTTKNHKAFLVVDTIAENKGTTAITLTPSDFVKLQVNNNPTDPAYKALVGTINAGKTYPSSMVFLVNDSDKSFVFSIGKNIGQSNILNVSF